MGRLGQRFRQLDPYRNSMHRSGRLHLAPPHLAAPAHRHAGDLCFAHLRWRNSLCESHVSGAAQQRKRNQCGLPDGWRQQADRFLGLARQGFAQVLVERFKKPHLPGTSMPRVFSFLYGFAARLTLTQYSGLGGGENAAFSSFGRRQASLAVSGTTIICCTAPLPLTSSISIVGEGPLAAALQSITARA